MNRPGKRFIILLSGVAVFLATVRFAIPQIISDPNQVEAAISFFASAVSITIAIHQVIRWVEKKDNEKSEPSCSTGKNHSTAKTENHILNPSTDEYRSDLYSEYRDSSEWRQYDDFWYRISRALSRFAYFIGMLAYKIPWVTPLRVWGAISVVMLLGWGGFVLSFAELSMNFGSSITFFREISSTFSIRVIESYPYPSFIFSLLVAITPFGYLSNRNNMSCDNCGADFSLTTLGRFYNVKWGKEKVEIRDNEGNITGHYIEYEGDRIRECEECGHQSKENTAWDDRGFF